MLRPGMDLRTHNVKPKVMYDTQLVLEASVAANRFNGEYVKENETRYNKDTHGDVMYNNEHATKWVVDRIKNKSLVYFLVTNKLPDPKWNKEENEFLQTVKIKITDADVQVAKDIKLHFQGKLFEALGGNLNEYVENIWKTLDTEQVSAREIGLLVSTPSAYYRDANKESIENTVLENCVNEYIGSVGDKIEGSVKVINAMYSTNYEAYIYTGIYDGKFLVNFWNGKELAKKDETINIKAKIKRLGLSKFYKGAWETSLNYVRKVDNKKELTKEKAFDAIVEGLKIISGDKK